MKTMEVEIMKAGGTSISAEGIKSLISTVGDAKKRTSHLVLVVSASAQPDVPQGEKGWRTTQDLRQMISNVISGGDWQGNYDHILDHHREIANGLKERSLHIDRAFNRDVLPIIEGVRQDANVAMIWKDATDPQLLQRIFDSAETTGEVISMKIVTAALNAAGIEARGVDSFECIKALGNYGNGVIDHRPSVFGICNEVVPILKRRLVAVVTGYRAKSKENLPIALGAGASDLTATWISRALSDIRGVTPVSTTILKDDVKGVLRAHPTLVPNAEVIDRLHFREGGDLGAKGAKVIHPFALQEAERAGVPVIVRSTRDLNNPGTRIDNEVIETLKGIAHMKGLKAARIEAPVMGRASGYLAELDAVFAKYDVSVDDSVAGSAYTTTRIISNGMPDGMLDELRAIRGVTNVVPLANFSRVALNGFGIGMNGGSEIPGRLFAMLKENNFSLQPFLPSPNDEGSAYYIYVGDYDCDRLVQCLHEAFFE